MPVESWDRYLAVLLRGVFLGIKHAAPVMISQQCGSIVNTAALDIARAVVWLADEESSFVNGQAIVIDGGLTAGGSWQAVAERLRPLAAALQQQGS